jgi:hypothetical protein
MKKQERRRIRKKSGDRKRLKNKSRMLLCARVLSPSLSCVALEGAKSKRAGGGTKLQKE